ncbi:MAG: CehA/McbA family metallohydrolase [Myxococcaceae bacterium]
MGSLRALAIGAVLALAGCKSASPCEKLKPACTADAANLKVFTISELGQRPLGWDADGAKGDVVLANQFTQAVIAGIGNSRFLDPNGGALIDLATPGVANDGINEILQVTGILPGDAAHYTRLTVIDQSPTLIAVQLDGTLDGHHDVPIHTRYELRPCDRGVRVRTEIVNQSKDTQMWALSDGWYWSKREAIPFTPGKGAGLVHPDFNLLTINDAYAKAPFLAATTHSGDQFNSYSEVSCTDGELEGFHSETVSSFGLARQVVPPRGNLVFDRFIAMQPDRAIAAAADQAIELRGAVAGEKHVRLHGKIERYLAPSAWTERDAVVQVSEGSQADPPERRTPWNQAVPDANGEFSFEVPAGKSYVVEVHAHGQKQVEKDFARLEADTELGTFTLPSLARVAFSVRDQNLMPVEAELFVIPADDATQAAVTGSLFGQFSVCAPWLGPPPGGSPACNRILVPASGDVTADVPAGRFFIYAFRGPFWTLGMEEVTLVPGDASVGFTLQPLALQPAGTLSADLHVHGAASFDSSLPDADRVLSFAASQLDVIAATDHDVVHDYSQLVKDLGLDSKMTTITGIETTGHIPFMRIPNYGFPLVIGHYNFWPVRYDPLLPRNNGPDDELIEPGELFDRVVARKDPSIGADEPLLELNHPWAAAEFGRDLGFPRALSLDLRKDLPAKDDGTAAGIYVRQHNSTHFNNGHEAQEVMNGSANSSLLPYRTFWWYLLNQGKLKTGTANSDSHSLVDDTVGLPRNLVQAATQAGPSFDINAFNAGIRAGHVLGTNGPIIEALAEGADGASHPYGLVPFAPKPGGTISVKVSAAPWVPIEEVRFIVNGQLVKTISVPAPAGLDELGSTGLQRLVPTDVSLDELLAGVHGDAWIVIEAGTRLVVAGDLGGGLDNALDGVPDTSDNNGDGKVDTADVKKGDKVGPLNNPPAPTVGQPGFHFFNITQGYPFAFTNPFVLDRDGDGKFTAPGVKGGR